MEMVGLDDGAVLLVAGTRPQSAQPDSAPSGTLAGLEEVLLWVGDAFAAGVTFEALKAAGEKLLSAGWKLSARKASGVQIVSNVKDHLHASGYADVVVAELREVDGMGWSFRGTADGLRLKGLTDRTGNIVHVRVK